MADKEIKSKSSPKSEKPKTTETKSTAKTAAKTDKTLVKKPTAAAKPAAKPTAKTETKTTAKPAVKAETAKSTAKSADVNKQAVASVVAKHSNPKGRKPVVIEESEPMKKAPKSKDAKVATVVEKYSNSRGKKTTIVSDMKSRKSDSFYNTSASAGEAAKQDTKTQTILLYILVALLVAALNVGLILSIITFATNASVPFAYAYKGQQAVGYYGEYIGTVSRNKPVDGIHDEGLSEYPVYGKNLSSVIGTDAAKVAARNALIRESSYLTATGTWNGGGGQYTWMDANGYLYSGTTANPSPTTYANGVHRQLYKHTASVGLYGGNVSDDEPGVIKQVTMRPRGYTRGYGVTGIYAPAGEVVKIELSGKDMDATGGIVIHIGQALYNGKANNIWAAKNQMQRFPVILNTMSVTKDTSTYNEETDTYTAYVGSFVGGPLYIRNESVTFSATISGGVNYSHFILGYTTPEEFEQNAKSSAPYFDLEVWSYGVLHSGPKSYAAKFNYEDLYKAAVLWEKVSLVSTTGSLQGIVFLYDPFVAAGAAVAFPGQGSVNCPAGWMTSSLNYNAIVTSGSWGNFHEYHHNFQGYGVGAGGEVTNNAMTLVSYSLFTKVSAARGLGNYGAAGMGGWNRYTSATWSLEQTLRIARSGASPENGDRGLALYSTLLHNFGPDNFIQAKVKQRTTGAYGENYAGYMQAWQDVVHYDMTYYFNDILGGVVNASLGNSEYPMFVPVSSVYQTGRGIICNGNTEYIETMQPYVISYGDAFTIDLRQYDAPDGQYSKGSIVVPDGFSFKVKNVSQPEHGSISQTDTDGVYTFIPDKSLRSGKIIVTLEITPSESFKAKYPNKTIEDVDLVLEFEQTHEKNKTVLERTVYTYDASKMYTDAEQAYNAGFAGYISAETVNHSNPTQNCNTDVWFVPDTDAGHKNFPNAEDLHIAKDNTITVIEGKLYFEDEGKYRVYLRGRKNCAVYYSLDEGKTYALGATIKDETVPKNSQYFRPTDENTYFDIEVGKESWLYFKEVLIVENAKASGTSYIGLGVKQWQEPLFTMQEKYYDSKGNEVTADDPNKDDSKTVVKYYNYMGIEVSAEVASNTDPIEPTINNSNQPYVNAYRSSYENITKEFTSEYFYTRNYTYSYKDNVCVNPEQTLVYTNYKQGMQWGNWSQYKAENIADGNRNTFIHTKAAVTEKNPLQFVIDMGEEKAVNRMTIYTQNRGGNKDWLCPRELTLEGSLDGNEFFLVDQFSNDVRNTSMTFNFEEKTFRYYRLTITRSDRLLIIAEIEMWHIFEVNDAAMLSPMNDSINYFGKWTTEQTFSDFGQVMVGRKNANVKFEFEGTRLGILSSKKFGTDFEVYIDGVKIDSLTAVKPLGEQTGEYGLSFLSDELESGKHSVTIKCLGEANFDAFAIYP